LDRHSDDTPLIKQYFQTKAKHPDAILLFRVGDFYEAYGQDAQTIVAILSIALTKKSNGQAGTIEMAGFPYHAIDNFLPKLVRAGKRVAICDQLEDPKLAKKLVKRGITELVTPGVSTNDFILNQKENNFLAGLHIEKSMGGIAFLDISTGEFYAAQGTIDYIDKLINSFSPKELVFERSKKSIVQECIHFSGSVYEMEDWIYTLDAAESRLLKHFQTANLKGFGVQDLPLALIASSSVLYYMDYTEHTQLSHIKTLSRIEEDQFVRLDRFTIKNLELCESLQEGGKSLLQVLDKTRTPMGARLFRKWLLFPLKQLEPIRERQDMTEYFVNHVDIREKWQKLISQVGDLERIASKIAVRRVTPRELVYLKSSLHTIEALKRFCIENRTDTTSDHGFSCLYSLMTSLDSCPVIYERIEREIVDDPPVAINRGVVFKSGVNKDLDELRNLSSFGKDYLNKLVERESIRTGITGLRIGYNTVFGYYIEVRNSQRDKVPAEWIRKQTLVNAERFITQELKEYEDKIVGADERIAQLESQLYEALLMDLNQYIVPVQRDAMILAQLDCLMSFAQVAIENQYVKPVLHGGDELLIKGGRHPVIEKQLPPGEPYIANDLLMDPVSNQIMIITGPNMAGKSAFLRQTALIVLMAQIGSFVPADSAEIGLIDKLFTRVGATDNISAGESTFMVEMNEAAYILNNLSAKSLILFDELGRGTSTYDGISIAWAIVEYIHGHPRFKPKTLFATHYHELNEMEKSFDRIKNYNVSVRETSDKVIFLRKLVRGGSEHSFGIHVAKMAGMPPSVVKRAGEILSKLEAENRKGSMAKPTRAIAKDRRGIN
jgi:DNA mismatch repair protein MutS